MHKQTQGTRHTPRCMASLDVPGTVEIELPRADGRVIPIQLDHQAAAFLARSLDLQSKLAELYKRGQEIRGN